MDRRGYEATRSDDKSQQGDLLEQGKRNENGHNLEKTVTVRGGDRERSWEGRSEKHGSVRMDSKNETLALRLFPKHTLKPSLESLSFLLPSISRSLFLFLISFPVKKF